MTNSFVLFCVQQSWAYSLRLFSQLYNHPLHCIMTGEYKQWNGLVEWNTGLDYWNDFFDLNLLFLLAMLAYSYFENYVRDESSKMWAHNKHIDILCA